MSVTFLPLGTTDEIGDACYLLEVDGTTLILDAGVHPQKEGVESLPSFQLASDRDPDAILISHCHLDHLGALPVALSHFPHARVLMSRASSNLAPAMLHHTVRVMERLQEEGAAGPPLYTHEDVDAISYVFQGMATDRPFPVDNLDNWGPVLKARFYDAGHILGAAGVWIEGPSGTLFYTGDTSAHAQEILPGAAYPESPVDLLITESTLGADPGAEERKRGEETRRFAQAITAVHHRGGSVLIPAFSLGRTQEMLALLHRLRENGRIPDVDIYTAGFGSVVSRLYDRTAHYTRRRDPGLRLGNLDLLPLPPGDVRKGPHLRHPSIVLVSSGMMAARTMSCRLAEVMLPEKRHGIFFVGYVDPEMPGYRVLTSGQGQRLRLSSDSPEISVQCQIERFYFSAHSSRRNLLHLVDRLNPRMVILVHAERGAKGWMRETIKARHPHMEVEVAEKGMEIEF